MEVRDLHKIVTLIGFVALFAGAGVAGNLLGRFQESPTRQSALEGVRAADAAPDCGQPSVDAGQPPRRTRGLWAIAGKRLRQNPFLEMHARKLRGGGSAPKNERPGATVAARSPHL